MIPMLKSRLIGVQIGGAKCGWTRRGVRYVTFGKQRRERRDEEGNERWGVLQGEEDERDEGNERRVSR